MKIEISIDLHERIQELLKGGPGSGNFGHGGRPGTVGGSTGGGGVRVGGLISTLSKTGGFSRGIKGNVPTYGFMVSPYKTREFVVPANKLTNKIIANYAISNRDVLNKADNYLGGWVYKKNVYLDISVLRPTVESATELAKQSEQLAIWDVAAGKQIDTKINLQTVIATVSKPTEVSLNSFKEWVMSVTATLTDSEEKDDLTEEQWANLFASFVTKSI